MFWSTIASPLIRHALTAGGAYLVARGAIDASQAAELVGAGAAIAGVAWSLIEKRVAWLRA